jgi:hypothetical protein
MVECSPSLSKCGPRAPKNERNRSGKHLLDRTDGRLLFKDVGANHGKVCWKYVVKTELVVMCSRGIQTGVFEADM